MSVSRTYQLELPMSQDQFDAIANRISNQFDRLRKYDINVSDLTRELMILTIMGIVHEPNKKWPPFSEDERVLMQDSFVDALALNFLNMTQDLEKRGRDKDIKIFDAIEATALNSWFSCCIITAAIKE